MFLDTLAVAVQHGLAQARINDRHTENSVGRVSKGLRELSVQKYALVKGGDSSISAGSKASSLPEGMR